VAKLLRMSGGQYVSTAQARLVQGEAKGVTRESAVTRSGCASVGDDDGERKGDSAVGKTGFRKVPDGED
jgi:hypothetical protein